MCEAAHMIGFWENLMRNVCIHMKMLHITEMCCETGVSILSHYCLGETIETHLINLWFFFHNMLFCHSLSTSLGVLISDWGTRAHWPPASVSVSVLVCGSEMESLCGLTYWRKNSLLTSLCVWKSFLANIGALYCTVPLPQ